MSRGIGLVLLASLLWGTTGLASSFAPTLSGGLVGAAAMGFGGLIMVCLAAPAIWQERLALRHSWVLMGIGGLAIACYALTFYASMRQAGVAIGTVVSIGSAPLCSAVLERLLDDARLTPRWALGAGLGVGGVLLLSLSRHSGGSAPNLGLGVLLGLAAGFTYAGYSWTCHRMIQSGVSSSVAVGSSFGVAAIPLLGYVASQAVSFTTPSAIAVVGYLALIPMWLGYRCFAAGLARVPASTATTVSLAEPVIATLLAVVILGERLPAGGWLGMALIGLSLAVLVGAVPTRLPRWRLRGGIPPGWRGGIHP